MHYVIECIHDSNADYDIKSDDNSRSFCWRDKTPLTAQQDKDKCHSRAKGGAIRVPSKPLTQIVFPSCQKHVLEMVASVIHFFYINNGNSHEHKITYYHSFIFLYFETEFAVDVFLCDVINWVNRSLRSVQSIEGFQRKITLGGEY